MVKNITYIHPKYNNTMLCMFERKECPPKYNTIMLCMFERKRMISACFLVLGLVLTSYAWLCNHIIILLT